MKKIKTTLFTCYMCTLLGAAQADAEPLPLDLEANVVRALNQGKIIEAKGDVVVTSETYGTVRANGLEYNSETNTLVAVGNVTFTDPQGRIIQTQHLEIDKELKQGITQVLLVSLGAPSGTHFWAENAELKNDDLYFNNAVYSACPLPEPLKQTLIEGHAKKAGKQPAPVWQIRSDQAVLNNDEDIITHRNMWFDVYGQPVFWLPWMRHAANSEKALSGFLRPQIATSGNRGQEVTTQFYWRQAQNLDATLEARFMSARGLLLSGEQRFVLGNTQGNIRAGIIDDDELRNTRGFLTGSVEHVVAPGRRFGINVEHATDDTFYDDFLGFNPNFLTSSVYAEDTSRNHYFGVTSTYFQDTRANQPSSATPQPIFHAEFNREFGLNRPGENLFIDTEFSSLTRDIGTDTRRLITTLGWQKHIRTADGHLFDLEASARGDIYSINNSPTNDNFETQITPEVSAMWQNPFISQDGKHVITPMIKAVGSTTNNNSPNIPNEDSLSFELDAANLFDDNRFAGEDRIENGLRVIYGLENTWTKNHNQAFNLFVGQSWRTGSDNVLGANSGHSTQLSDWVGQARLQSGIFRLTSRFRLDKDTFSPQRIDNFFTVGTPGETYLGLVYSFENDGTEEIRGDARWQATKDWAISGNWQQDLTGGGRLLQAQGGLTYTHCCYEVSFLVRRRGFENRNVESSTDFIINFSLLTLGRDE